MQKVKKYPKQTQDIIKKYQKIYNFFFKYSIYFVILIIGIIFLINKTSSNKILDKDSNFIIEKTKLIGEFNKLSNTKLNKEDIKIYIINDQIQITGNLLFSLNNLISYKDIIMPKIVFYEFSGKKENIDFLKNKNYDIDKFKTFFESIIFANIDQTKKQNTNSILLPLSKSINQTFYLDCIKYPKIINGLCNKYINNFINTFFVYDISKDYKGLKQIFENIKQTEHKDGICKSILKYSYYSNNTPKEIESILIECGNNYYQEFDKLKIFFDIQKQLEKGYIDQNIYMYKDLNAYKLISYQQIIYNDIKNKQINPIHLNSYTNYIKNILKNTDKIDEIYLDVSYRFNNYYLINVLSELKYKGSKKTKEDIINTINNINKINLGDNILGYIGLENNISNKNLITNLDSKKYILETTNNDIIKNTLEEIKNLSFLKVIKEKTSGDKIKINGYFSIKTKDEIIPVFTSFIIKNYTVKTININGYEDLNKIIKEIITKKDHTITEVYQYIQENIELYLSNNNISTCNLIKNILTKTEQENSNIQEIKIMSCKPSEIKISKTIKEKNNGMTIFYNLTLDNFNIIETNISDIYIQKDIKELIKNIKTNNITIPKIIGEIIKYEKINESNKIQGSNDTIICIEDFQKYLNIIPDNIIESEKEIEVEFTIQGIKLKGTYNVENNLLSKLSFYYNEKKINSNNNIDKNDLKINNFKLILEDNNKNKINEFLISPLNFISKIDNNTVQNYKKLEYK